jgi:uncharacterized membrane protein
MSYLSKSGQILFWVMTLGVALVSYRFFPLGLEQAFQGMSAHILERPLAFIMHISLAPVALIIGLFQFLPGLRSRRPALHRWSGRIYLLAVTVSGFAGLTMALASFDRPVAAVGFAGLAVFWLVTTGRAVQLAMGGRISDHRRWMIRSYALTLAAVTLRIYLPAFFVIGGMDYAEASNYVAWLCWAPNILLAEFILRLKPQWLPHSA